MKHPKIGRQVGQYDKDWNLIKIWVSMSEAGRHLNIKPQNIYKACRGYKTTLNGYNFKYED